MSYQEWSRVFVCHDTITAQAVVGLLETQGIETRVRDLSVSPYPVSIGPLSERHIEVPSEDAQRAAAALDAARRDGILEGN